MKQNKVATNSRYLSSLYEWMKAFSRELRLLVPDLKYFSLQVSAHMRYSSAKVIISYILPYPHLYWHA